MRSIEQHLRAGLVASLVGLFAVLGLAAYLLMLNLTERFVATRIAHDTEALLAALQLERGMPALPEARIPAIYGQPFSGHYYVVLAGERTLRSRSLWDETLSVPPLAPGNAERWQTEGPAGQRLLVTAAGFEKQGVRVTIAAAEDLSPLLTGLRRSGLWLGGLMALGLVVLLLVQRQLLRRAFRPVDAVQDELHALDAGEVERLGESVPAEIRPLVREVNRLIATLNTRLQRSRNAVGNLAHALKGPLSLLAQASEDGRLSGRDQLAAEVREQTGRLQRLVESELTRARLAGGGSPAQRFAVREELPALVTLVQRLQAGRRIAIDWSSAYDELRVDRDDMLALLGNLLDNAGKWAHSRVQVAIEPAGAGFVLTVADDGPGVEAEALARLTERGVRVDEAVPGHGLGLAIVRDVAAAYGGSLQFGRSAGLGGFEVRVTLPVGGA